MDAYFASSLPFAVGSDLTALVSQNAGTVGTLPNSAPPTVVTITVPAGSPLPPDSSTYGPISYTWSSTFNFLCYYAFVYSGDATNQAAHSSLYGALLQGVVTITFHRQLLSITKYVHAPAPPPPTTAPQGIPPPPVGGWWGHYIGHIGFGWGAAQNLYPPSATPKTTRTPQGIVRLADGTLVPLANYVPASVSWNNGNAIEFVAGVVQAGPKATPGNTPPALLIPGVARSLDHGETYRLAPFKQTGTDASSKPFGYLRGSLDPYRNRIVVIGWRGTWDAVNAEYDLSANSANSLVLRVYPQKAGSDSGAYDDTRPETTITLPQVDGNRLGSPCGGVWDIEVREDGGVGFLYLDINNYVYLVSANMIPSDSSDTTLPPIAWLSQRLGPTVTDAAGNGPTAPVFADARFAWGRGGTVLAAVIAPTTKTPTIAVMVGRRMTQGSPVLTWSAPAPALDAKGKPLPLASDGSGQVFDIWTRPGDGTVHLASATTHYICPSLAADGTGVWTQAYPKAA